MAKTAKTEFTWLLRHTETGLGGKEGSGRGISRPGAAVSGAQNNDDEQSPEAGSQRISTPLPDSRPAKSNGNNSSNLFDDKNSSPGTGPKTASLLPGLELIRGLACLQVFVSHIFIVLMFHSRAKINPSYWKLEVLNWSYESVIVFFVLSGYVIALSQQRKQRDSLSFMTARFHRLGPLYLVAVAVSFGLEALFYPPPAYTQLLGHLLFIQGSTITPVFNTNAPLWSLGYEFYFYLIFAFTIGRNWKYLNISWFILGLGAIVLSLAGFTAPGVLGYFQGILCMSPVWLLGVLLVHRPFYVRTNISQNLVLFGMLPLASHSLPFLGSSHSAAHSLLIGLLIAPLLCSAAQTQPVRSHSSLFSWVVLFGLYCILTSSFLMNNQGLNHHTEIVFALTVPFILPLLVPIYHSIFGKDKPFFTPRLTSFSLGLGKMSYAIYIIHFPILMALGATMTSPVPLIIVGTILVMLAAWLLEYRLQPVFGTLFKSHWQSSDTVVSH